MLAATSFIGFIGRSKRVWTIIITISKSCDGCVPEISDMSSNLEMNGNPGNKGQTTRVRSADHVSCRLGITKASFFQQQFK